MNSIAARAEGAADQVRESATRTSAAARSTFLDLGTQVLRFVNGLRAFEARTADGLLDRVGLQRRESALRPVVWFAAGAVTAGAAVLVLAPSSGKHLRRQLAKLFTDGADEAKHLEHVVEAKLEAAAGDAKKAVANVAHTAESRVGGALDEVIRRNGGAGDVRS